MKKNLLVFSFVLLTVLSMVSDVSGIGISPARWTNDLLDIDPSFDSGMTYSLGRPSTRYSEFTVYNAAGLSGTITGYSVSSGVEYINDNTIRIDWESDALSSTDNITASIQVQSPESWACPAEPGGNSYLADLVRHIEVVEPGSGIGGVAAVISEISFWRNYAPRAYLQSSATTELAVSLGLQFEDKHETWWAKNPEFAWFRYDIDWDNDGIFDQSGNATLDEEAVFQNNIYRWTSGFQTSTLDLEHVYETGGNYTATISVTDLGYVSGETTTFQVPINVIPEPTTLALLGLGGLFLRKNKLRTK